MEDFAAFTSNISLTYLLLLECQLHSSARNISRTWSNRTEWLRSPIFSEKDLKESKEILRLQGFREQSGPEQELARLDGRGIFCGQVFSDYDPSSATSLLSSVIMTSDQQDSTGLSTPSKLGKISLVQKTRKKSLCLRAHRIVILFMLGYTAAVKNPVLDLRGRSKHCLCRHLFCGF